MTTDYSSYIRFILDILSIYAVYRFLNLFHGGKAKNKKVEILSYVGYFLIDILLSKYIRIPILMSVMNLIFLFLITLNYRSAYKKRILSVFLMYFILLITEIIAGILTQYIYTSLLKQSTLLPDTGYLIKTILLNIVVLIFYKMKKTMSDEFAPRMYWVCICVDILIILYIVFSFSLDNNILQITILCALMFVSNYAVVYLCDVIASRAVEREEKQVILDENKSYQKQIEIMSMYTKNSDSFQHNLKNHFILLKAFIENGEKAEALDELETLNNTMINKKYVKTGVKIVDSILNSKIFEAENYGIHVDYKVIIPYDISYDDFDMTILFGNLMDFAIREVKKVQDGDEKNISLEVMFEIDSGRRGWLNIELEHPVLIETITLELIEMGLNNVLKVVEKYDGKANYGTMGNEFKVEIKMLML